ncbi:hypothetical protein HDU98_002122 [Podochytrium sp. JEL0797]|nr:hypothetical protein HDU98_002122 [Podochytrium sp. JEL0797]
MKLPPGSTIQTTTSPLGSTEILVTPDSDIAVDSIVPTADASTLEPIATALPHPKSSNQRNFTEKSAAEQKKARQTTSSGYKLK